MNNFVFNNRQSPLYVNAMSAFDEATILGNAYVAATNLNGALSVAGGAAMMLLNPATSTKRIILNRIYLYNTGANILSGLTLVKNAEMQDKDPVDMFNLNFASSNVSTAVASMKVNLVTAPSRKGKVIRTIGSIASLYATTDDTKYVLAPGTSISVRTVATVSVSLTIYAEFSWWEEAL